MAAQVGVLVQQYKTRIAGTVDKLKDGAANPQGFVENNLGQLKALVQVNPNEIGDKGKASAENFQRTVSNLGPATISAQEGESLMDQHLWVAVCLFIQGIVFMFSRLILSGVYGLFFDTFVAVLIATFALPAFGFMKLQKLSDMPNDDLQMILMALNAFFATFTGFIVSGRLLGCASPPLFLIPLCMGLVLGVAGPGMAGTRPVLIGAAVGSSVALMFLYGVIAGFSFGYLIWILVLAGVAAVDLQIQLSAIPSSPRSRIAAQWRLITILNVVNLLLYLMMSSARVPEENAK